MYLNAYIIRPVTAPYTASSAVIAGSMAMGGIWVRSVESAGPSRPQTSPYCQPQISPQRSTGMCMGRNIVPAFLTA